MKKENKKLATILLESENRPKNQRVEEHFTSIRYVSPSKEELDEILPDEFIRLLKELFRE